MAEMLLEFTCKGEECGRKGSGCEGLACEGLRGSYKLYCGHTAKELKVKNGRVLRSDACLAAERKAKELRAKIEALKAELVAEKGEKTCEE